MRGVILLLTMMAATLVLASGVALAVGVGSAGAHSSIVGPGESIQKAVNAAHPGDTIVVKGVHKEDVVISKDGIKLRGEDAVIEAPPKAKADSPCAPEAICIRGNVTQTGEITGPRVSDVSVSGFMIRGFRDRGQPAFSIDVAYARNATVAGNRVKDTTGRIGGIGVTVRSINTTFANNHVIGNPDSSAPGIRVEVSSSRTTIANNVIRNIPEGDNAIDVAEGSADTTVAGNHFIDDWLGVFVEDSPGTKVISNVMSGNGVLGMYLAGQESRDTKVVGNDISGGPWGIYVTDAHQGSFVGNTIHDNCAGMFFEAPGAVGDFKVKANTVTDNTRSCRSKSWGRNFSGIGIALLGARGMEVKGNHLSGNIPSGPTRISGGVVVSTDPYFGTTKPKNDSIIGNHFGRNKPDIFWDESGSGNRFVGNLCNTSVPSRLCN